MSFRGESEFSVYASDVDKNGDFIIVGGHWNEDFYGDTRDFYLKVQSDGTITSTRGPVPEDISVVYPNPTSGSVNLKKKDERFSHYEVYNTRGEKVKSAELNSSGQFNISDLSSGTYYIQFMDEQKKEMKRTKVVKY